MLRSMTGYGSAAARIEGIDYTVEIRSVNGRYFKAGLRLPEIWASMETEIEGLLRRRLYRGTVSFAVRLKQSDEAAALSVNAAALRRYVEQVRSALGDSANLDAGTLLQLPGVCVTPSPEELVEKSWPALLAAIEQAVDRLLEMRKREGQDLYKDLMDHCQAVETQLAIVESRKGLVVEDYHRRLTSRVNELIASAKIAVAQQDLMREVAVFAERCDISEEISRLRGHLGQFSQVAGEEDQGGRKLDFISQEMLREANTIASKANDAQIARATVEIKGSIDRIKEQVQNVE